MTLIKNCVCFTTIVLLSFGDQFQKARGMYFSDADRGCMNQMMYNWPCDDVDVVVTRMDRKQALAIIPLHEWIRLIKLERDNDEQET